MVPTARTLAPKLGSGVGKRETRSGRNSFCSQRDADRFKVRADHCPGHAINPKTKADEFMALVHERNHIIISGAYVGSNLTFTLFCAVDTHTVLPLDGLFCQGSKCACNHRSGNQSPGTTLRGHKTRERSWSVQFFPTPTSWFASLVQLKCVVCNACITIHSERVLRRYPSKPCSCQV